MFWELLTLPPSASKCAQCQCREAVSGAALRKPTLAARLLRALLRAPTLARPDGTNWEQLYQRVGACLGQMGALDPSKVRLAQDEPVAILEEAGPLTAALLRPIVQQLRVATRISVVEICMYSVQMMMPGAWPLLGRSLLVCALAFIAPPLCVFSGVHAQGTVMAGSSECCWPGLALLASPLTVM